MSQSCRRPSPYVASSAVTCLLLAICTGCADEIMTNYGSRGGLGSTSVNGTTVLSEMFKAEGHTVETRRALTPALREANTIVWFPDSFKEPGEKVRNWFEGWLTEQPGRTLIYVARDFDAAPGYWQTIRSGAPADQQEALKERHANAKEQFANDQSEGTISQTSPWFTIDRPRREKQVHDLQGPWSEGIEAGRAKILLYSRLRPSAAAQALLASGEDVLVTRQIFPVARFSYDYYSVDEQSDSPDTEIIEREELESDDANTESGGMDEFESSDQEAEMDAANDEEPVTDPSLESPVYDAGTSQLITVVNGSFLLNLPLVNHEHRELAGKLVAETAYEGHTVFLESGATDPPILAEEPDPDYGPGLKYLEVWPVGPIVLHLAVLGIIFCFSRWPIFGTPPPLPAGAASDFGKHVQALGKLLSRTKDQDFARSRIEDYQSKRRES